MNDFAGSPVHKATGDCKSLLLPQQSQIESPIFSQYAAGLRLWWNIMSLAIHHTKARGRKLQEEAYGLF